MISAVSENGYLFLWKDKKNEDGEINFEMKYSRKIHGGSIEALCVRNI